MTNLKFNINNLKLQGGDFITSSKFQDELVDEISEICDQSQEFQVNGSELIVIYTLRILGSIHESSGDYWTSASCEVSVDSFDVDITEILIDGFSVELSRDIKRLFTKIVTDNL